MKIDFYLRFHTKFKETLWITGNIDELGNDDHNLAFPMTYINEDFWHANIEVDSKKIPKINYKYIFKTEHDEMIFDWENKRLIEFAKGVEIINIIDTWSHAGEYENVFFTDPFQKTWFRQNETKFKVKADKKFTHIFKVKAPLLKKMKLFV